MKAVVDPAGRIVIPKVLRDALGLQPGSTVEISRYGAGLHLLPIDGSARIDEDGVLVATGTGSIDDETVLALRAARGAVEEAGYAELGSQQTSELAVRRAESRRRRSGWGSED